MISESNFFRLKHIPIIIFCIWAGFVLKGKKKDLNPEQLIEKTGIISAPIKYGDFDGSYYINFKLDSLDKTFQIDGIARSAIKSMFGLNKFEKHLQVGKRIELAIDKKDYLNDDKRISVKYLTIDSTLITSYNDYENFYNSNVETSHNIYPYIFIFAFILFLKGLFVINIQWRKDKLKNIDEIYDLKLENLKNFNLGEYIVDYDKGNQKLIINNSNWTKVIINFNEKFIQQRILWFFVKIHFKDIECFGLINDEGSVDVAMRTKMGNTFDLINTKSSGFKFLDPNRKDKEKIEYVFLSIFNSILTTHPNPQ